MCGPFAARGLRGKESTPSIWLGGTGEFLTVSKQEQERQEHRFIAASKKAMVCVYFVGEIECMCIMI